MRTAFHGLRFQGKLLVPVMALMGVLIIVTLWVVNNRITRQVQSEAADALTTADAVFRNSQKIREKNLLLRYGDIPNEGRFKAVVQLGEAKTMQFRLNELLTTLGVDLIQFTTSEGVPLAVVSRAGQFSTGEFTSNTLDAVSRALVGQAVVDAIMVNDRLFDVVAIPVHDGDSVSGALTIGTECGDVVAKEFHELTRSEVLFLARGQVTASTLRNKLWHPACVQAFRGGDPQAGPSPIDLGGDHYLGLPGRFKTLAAHKDFGYLVLVSYEPALEALQKTQRVLLGVGLLGLLASILITWAVVRKLTQPLRQLRDTAEAVGRGDFSRRVAIQSNDECGDLALAFNQMTQNLAAARNELEQTVATLQTTRAQLTQSEKLSAIGEFVAGVAHELNNPLTTVIGFAELLQRAKVDERHRRQLEMVECEARRCGRIVKSLLSFARRHKPERKPTALNDVIHAAIEILAYQLRTSNVEIRLQLAPELPLVVADPHQIQQVIVNIVNNARQAIDELERGGWIAIRTAVAADLVRITIQDNGPGIAPENVGKIFDPFFTTKEVGRGTGLGLSLCYGIVKEHGGTISVQSTLGDGSTFSIELPMATPEGTASPLTAAQSILPEATGQGKRVLVVDDEGPIVELIRQVLMEAGYEVDTAADGRVALEQAAATHYDLILCDWKMPGLTGREVYERLAATNPQAAANFIFITGDVINERTQAFLRQHDKQCLAKPFSLQDFRRAVAAAVQ